MQLLKLRFKLFLRRFYAGRDVLGYSWETWLMHCPSRTSFVNNFAANAAVLAASNSAGDKDHPRNSDAKEAKVKLTFKVFERNFVPTLATFGSRMNCLKSKLPKFRCCLCTNDPSAQALSALETQATPRDKTVPVFSNISGKYSGIRSILIMRVLTNTNGIFNAAIMTLVNNVTIFLVSYRPCLSSGRLVKFFLAFWHAR